MARTAVVLDGQQAHALTALAEAARVLKAWERGIEARLATERAQYETARDAALWEARRLGVPIRELLPALGTTNPNTVYLIEARKPKDYTSVGTGPVKSVDWNAIVSVQDGRVSVDRVPVGWWTFEKGTDRPADVWSGWIDVRDGQVVDSSEYPGPLQAEWLYGDGKLREAVGL